jgi:hypothetical protein
MIRTKFPKLLSRGALFVCVVVVAQSVAQNQSPVRDPQALAFLAQCSLAMGASSIQDSYAQGTLTTADPNAPAVPITTRTKGAAERFDISKDNQTYVMNGGSSWAMREGRQARMPYALVAYHRPEHVPALACVLDVDKANMSFVYVGQEQIMNRVVHHIRIFVPAHDDNTESLISELNVFLDAQRFVILKAERYVFDPEAYQNRSVWATYYGDYRTVGAALMPFHIENYLDGHKVRDVNFSSVQVNVGVQDRQLQDPSGQSQ